MSSKPPSGGGGGGSGGKGGVQGVIQTTRRTWDQDVYARKAKEREEREIEESPLVKKPNNVDMKTMKPATARVEEVLLDSNLGKTQVLQGANAKEAGQTAGFFCDACNCLIKDSQNYLDHINGKKHQRALGTSLRPERATLIQVRHRLQMHKEKQKEAAVTYEDFDVRMDRLRQQEEDRKREQREKKKDVKKEKKKQDEQALAQFEVDDPEMAAMGLPTGFK